MIRLAPLVLAFAFAARAQYYVVSTIAGNGQVAAAPGGASALSARLVNPRYVAADAAGNVYISDPYFNQVYQVTANGVWNVFAGAGRQGFSGDGGLATAALLDGPNALAVDTAGSVYISDNSNGRIRRVTPDGMISTFVSIAGVSGLAFDAAGNLYASQGLGTIRRITPAGVTSVIAGTGTAGFSGDGGPATAAMLSSPFGLAFDAAGNLFFADAQNNRVRRITPAGVISTVAGDGNARLTGDTGPALAASLAGPAGVAIDAAGDLYIADASNGRVRRVRQGIITTVGGGGGSYADGAATEASLPGLTSITLDSRGGLLMAVSAARQVRRFSGSTVTTIAGVLPGLGASEGAPALETPLFEPHSVAVTPSGAILVSDSVDNRVRRIDATGAMTTFAGNGLFGNAGANVSANAAQVGVPRGLAFDAAGNLFISSGAGATIRRVNAAGVISLVAGNGVGFAGDNGPALNAMFFNPNGLAVDTLGNLYIADASNNRVRRISGTTITTFAGTGSVGSGGDGEAAAAAQLSFPRYLAFDRTGNLHIADTNNHRVRRVTPAGVISTVAGNGAAGFAGDGGAAAAAAVGSPTGIAFDEAGHLYIATANRVRKVDAATQTIATIAGEGNQGFSGDGGLATNARFDIPQGLAIDSTGAVLVVDQRNQRLRKLTPARIVAEAITNGATLRAGAVAPGEIITLFGFDLGPTPAAGLQLDAGGRVATSLGGTRVTFDGVPAPLLYVSASQVNVIVPYGVAGAASTQVQVTYNNRPTNTVTLPVTSASPGVFATTNANGSLNAAANPAAPGSVLILYGTGEGQTVPAGVDGQVATSVFPKPALPVAVQIAGRPAEILYMGAAPGFVSGVFQMNVSVPAGLTGNLPMQIRMAEAVTSLNVFVR